MSALSTWAVSVEHADAPLTRLFTIDPLSDSRWDALAASHPKASVFHQKAWLQALSRTYGYRPLALTSSPEGGSLRDGIVFCLVQSWITGSRMVSLPFADHCDPLLNEHGDGLQVDSPEFSEWMRLQCDAQRQQYIELRPLSLSGHANGRMVPGQPFWFHALDLTPSLEKVFSGLHKDSMQRRIRHAEREQLSYEAGSSDQLVDDFYRLLVITRRRHRLLPQPRSWFRNLIACMGENVRIRVARKERVPVAAMLTLHHRNTVVYKYGCSDERFHHLAGMPFLYWKLIEEAKGAGSELLDLGRTDLDNESLAVFKDRLGAERRPLSYLRYPSTALANGVKPSGHPVVRRLFATLPDVVMPWAGRFVYRHMG
jgi:CelD/BcsL family acetyltransferase involved in cellulose biosynthesis